MKHPRVEMIVYIVLIMFKIIACIEFDCVRDVPSAAFLSQQNSFIKYYNIDSTTSIEVQIFNVDKLNSTIYTPLLFIHGYTDSRWSFLSTIQCLNIYNRPIIVPSLRGFGDSQIYSSSTSTFSMEEFAADLIKLLDLLSIDKAVWIGHSMGSWISHYAAGTYPSRVESTILVATGLVIPAETCDYVDMEINTTCPSRAFIDAFQEFDVLKKDISLDYAYQVVRESYKVDIDPYQKAWYELCDFDKGTTYLGSIEMNATIIWGESDTITPVDQSFVDLFTKTQPVVHVIKEVGHNVQWFRPDEVSDIIIDHINYVEPTYSTTMDDNTDNVCCFSQYSHCIFIMFASVILCLFILY